MSRCKRCGTFLLFNNGCTCKPYDCAVEQWDSSSGRRVDVSGHFDVSTYWGDDPEAAAKRCVESRDEMYDCLDDGPLHVQVVDDDDQLRRFEVHAQTVIEYWAEEIKPTATLTE